MVRLTTDGAWCWIGVLHLPQESRYVQNIERVAWDDCACHANAYIVDVLHMACVLVQGCHLGWLLGCSSMYGILRHAVIVCLFKGEHMVHTDYKTCTEGLKNPSSLLDPLAHPGSCGQAPCGLCCFHGRQLPVCSFPRTQRCCLQFSVWQREPLISLIAYSSALTLSACLSFHLRSLLRLLFIL